MTGPLRGAPDIVAGEGGAAGEGVAAGQSGAAGHCGAAGESGVAGHWGAAADSGEGGDPACWADQVCEDCGRIREGPDHRCQGESSA